MKSIVEQIVLITQRNIDILFSYFFFLFLIFFFLFLTV